MKNSLLLLLISLLFITSCREDAITSQHNPTILDDIPEVSFLVFVVDEDDKPLEGVEANFLSNTYTSNENGIIRISDATVRVIGSKMTLSSASYLEQFKMITGETSQTEFVKVIMLRGRTDFIDTGSEGEIDGQARLTLPTTLLKEDGSEYSDGVSVKSKYLDPDNKDFLRQAPGNLIASNSDEELVQLVSLGMISIELFDDQGRPLTIPEGEKAEIRFPIAEAHEGSVPDKIPLWYFDEEGGIWVEDGFAQVQDDFMVTEVSHFTWWNCDLPYVFTPICLQFVDNQGDPVSGVDIYFSIDGMNFGIATTNANGNILGNMPIGPNVTVEYEIGGVQYGPEDIGTFEINERKKIINLDLNVIIVSGLVRNCDDQPLESGYGFYNIQGRINIVTINKGAFLYNMPSMGHILTIYDLVNEKEFSVEVVANSHSVDVDLGIQKACETAGLTGVSGKVFLDTNDDGQDIVPLAGWEIEFYNILTGQKITTSTQVDGSYFSYLEPNVLYQGVIQKSDVSDNYSILACGDLATDGDHEWEAYADGRQGLWVQVEEDEHDKNNNVLMATWGEGLVLGSAFADTDNDGVGDVPMTWLPIFANIPGPNSEGTRTIVDEEGDFSMVTSNGSDQLGLNIAFETGISDYDASPDPDGNDQDLGPNGVIPLTIRRGEVDSDNNFVIGLDRSYVIARVFEDLNNDGLADRPIKGKRIRFQKTGDASITYSVMTDEQGIVILPAQPGLGESFDVVFEDILNYNVYSAYDEFPDNNLGQNEDYPNFYTTILQGKEWDAGITYIVQKK